MTVNTTDITAGPYIGNGVTTAFAYGFRVDVKTQVQVYERTSSTASWVLQTVDTDYTVGGLGVDGGGTITRVAGALPSNYEWYIRANYPATQDTDFDSGGDFAPETHEAAFDKLTFLVQQVLDLQSRSLRLASSSDLDGDLEFTEVDADRQNTLPYFDATGALTMLARDQINTTALTVDTIVSFNAITATGTNTKVVTPEVPWSAYEAGQGIRIKNVTANNASVAINISSLGAQVVRRLDGLTLTRDDMLPGGVYDLVYDGTDFIILNPENNLYRRLSVTGTNTKVGTPSPAWSGYVADRHIVIKNVTTNTGAVTLNLNGLGTRDVVAQGGDALVGGEMVAAGVYILVDNGTHFILLNPTPVKRSFRAKLSSGQGSIATGTATKINCDSEIHDSHGEYDNATNYRWTPQRSGYYLVGATVQSTGLADGNYSQTFIYKNGSADSTRWDYMPGVNGPTTTITALIYLDGDTDYVELFWEHNSGTDETAQPANTVFWGVGPF